MARKIKDATLDSREARGKLKPRGKPYWRTIERGLHLGYRRLKAQAGTWWARHYLGNQQYEIEAIGAADDLSDADGIAIIDYWQAQTKARERMVARAHAAAGKTTPLTVKDAVEEYLEWMGTNRKSAYDAQRRAMAFIYPKLGDIECASLTADILRKWHVALVKEAPRLRTRPGEKQNHRAFATDDDFKRRRQATANRTLTILKAALNRAWRASKVPSDSAWRRVEPFENVDAARVRYLTEAECVRLVNAADPEFRPLVQAALQSGCRYGELIRLQCHDFNPDTGTLAIRQSKSGKARHVVLTEEAGPLFASLCAGRAGNELMLRKANGNAWGAAHQGRPMAAACEHANIKPAVSFHVLRHTHGSALAMKGVPMGVIAQQLGHADTRMTEKHYAHLAPSYVAKAIRDAAPRFGLVQGNVTPIGARQ